MNTRIYKLFQKNLEVAFNLPKYDTVRENLSKNTRLDFLPWTPARKKKFEESIESALDLQLIDFSGTFEEIVDRLDKRYMNRFFGEIWQPETDKYQFSGWQIADVINKQNPKKVLDFGCGYNPFKPRIDNLIGIDAYNNAADYMVDILEFDVEPESFDHIIVFGSLNFNSIDEIQIRFKKLNELLMPGGRMYFRANPGHLWSKGIYVDIFPWDFKTAYDLAKTHNLELEKFKKDNGDRLYFEFYKPS